MTFKFWNKKTPESVVEPVKERSYFETVAETGATKRMLQDAAPSVTGPEMAMKR